MLTVAAPLLSADNVHKLSQVMDVFASARPVVTGIDMPVTNAFMSAATPALTAVGSFFNTTYKTQILPTSVIDLASGILSTDIAPTATKIETISGQVLQAIAGMPIKAEDYNQGNVYASLATGFSFAKQLTAKLVVWKPPSKHSKLDPSWIENLLFGESALSWLNKQGNETSLHNLGAVCDNVHAQIESLDLASLAYSDYLFDGTKIGVNSEKLPLKPKDVATIAQTTANICAGLKSA